MTPLGCEGNLVIAIRPPLVEMTNVDLDMSSQETKSSKSPPVQCSLQPSKLNCFYVCLVILENKMVNLSHKTWPRFEVYKEFPPKKSKKCLKDKEMEGQFLDDI
jgi:hypothetical protein